MLLDHLRIYHQTIYYIQVQIQNAINGKEALRNAQTLVGGVIQSTLKPLGGSYQHRVHDITHHIVGKRRDTLAAHRVSLVSHSRGTDLVLLKGLFYFF